MLASFIFFLKVGVDLLSYFKIDAFNKSQKFYYSVINLIETVYVVYAMKITLDAARESLWYLIVFGAGAVVSGLLSTIFKSRLDDKIKGQRKFFTRITVVDHTKLAEIVQALKDHNFDLAITEEQIYTSGEIHSVIAGSLEDRKRMNEIKNILRNKTGFHVVFIRAEDIFMV